MKDITALDAYRILQEHRTLGDVVKEFIFSNSEIPDMMLDNDQTFLYGVRIKLRNEVPEDEMWCEYIGADGQPHRQVVKLT